MAIINQSNILNLQPGITAPVVVHMSEGDVGTKLSFKLIDGARAWTDPGNVVAAVHGRRQDGTQFGPYVCSISKDTISFQSDAAMAGAAGSGIAEIVLTDSNGNSAGSANFAVMVERATFPQGVTYRNDVSVYEAILAYAQSAPAQISEDFMQKLYEEALTRELADSEIQTQLTESTNSLQSQITTEVETRTQQAATLSARMDEFTKLPDGSLSTAADAELVDIRVMADGTTAETAGDAVRTQFTALRNDFTSVGRAEKALRVIDCEKIDGVMRFPTGTITSGTDYTHIEYELQGERYLYISGWAFSAAYGVYGFMNASGQIFAYDSAHATSAEIVDLLLEVPIGATKIVVNGLKSKIRLTCIKTYAETVRTMTENLPSENIYTDLEELTTVSHDGVVMHVNGTEQSGQDYAYVEAALEGGETLYVSGVYYAREYPSLIIYDEDGNVIYRPVEANSKHVSTGVIKCQESARKIIVNGASKLSALIAPPSAKKYATEETLYTSLRKMGLNRRFLFVGDSYCEGYSHDGRNNGWALFCAGYMGLSESDYVRVYRGGARFSENASDNTYLALLNSTNYPMDYFTDVVVCGGYNDHSYQSSVIMTGIQTFITRCKAKYPNARIHIGAVAYNKQGNGDGAEPNWQAYRTQIETVVVPTYQKCVEYGAEYLNNVEYWLGESGLTPSDGYHPSAEGNQSIGRAVANALLTGSAPLPYNSIMRNA